jgi:hypothetical protein
MRIKSIKKVGRKPVYDLSLATDVYDKQHYVLKNGVVTHNTGIMYSANQVFIISKAQEKAKDDTLAGWKFTINIEKSRYVREKSKLPFTVLYGSGIQRWSALFDLALEAGFLIKPKVGWYQLIDPETGEVSEKNYREAEVQANDEFFERLTHTNAFKEFIEKKYKLSADEVNPSAFVDEDVDIDD